jgi:hypothetical protein
MTYRIKAIGYCPAVRQDGPLTIPLKKKNFVLSFTGGFAFCDDPVIVDAQEEMPKFFEVFPPDDAPVEKAEEVEEPEEPPMVEPLAVKASAPSAVVPLAEVVEEDDDIPEVVIEKPKSKPKAKPAKAKKAAKPKKPAKKPKAKPKKKGKK